MHPHDRYARDILQEIEANGSVSQRGLSRKLGVALGLTNLLVRRLVAKGCVELRPAQAHRVCYAITPAGLRERARITSADLEDAVRLYRQARDRVHDSLTELSATWPTEELAVGGEKRIVFYGAGELAEIGYLCLQGTDLRLVGVVDDRSRDTFFGLPVHAPDRLEPTHLDDVPYGRLVLMSFRRNNRMLARLKARGISRGRIHSLCGGLAGPGV